MKRGYWRPRGGGLERLEVLCPLSAGGRAVPAGTGFLCPWHGRGRLFFPSRGKEPKGARWQPNRDSTMAAPGLLSAWAGGGTSCHARLFASSRGRLGAAWGIMPVVRWRPGGTSGPPSLRARWWALERACGVRCDRSGTLRFTEMVHGRRSLSSLRRPPQEVAASLDHGGARNPHAKRGDRRGAPPERDPPSPLPRRGRCHGESRDG